MDNCSRWWAGTPNQADDLVPQVVISDACVVSTQLTGRYLFSTLFCFYRYCQWHTRNLREMRYGFSLCIQTMLLSVANHYVSKVILCLWSDLLHCNPITVPVPQELKQSFQLLLTTKIAVYLMTFLIVTVAWAAHIRYGPLPWDSSRLNRTFSVFIATVKGSRWKIILFNLSAIFLLYFVKCCGVSFQIISSHWAHWWLPGTSQFSKLTWLTKI